MSDRFLGSAKFARVLSTLDSIQCIDVGARGIPKDDLHNLPPAVELYGFEPDGKELWRRPVTMIDLLDDAERTKGSALVEDWWQAMMDRSAMPLAKVGGNYYTGFPKWLHYQRYWAEETGIWTPAQGSADDERKGASPELIALLDKRDELQKAADPVAVQEELNNVLKAIEKELAKTMADDPDSRQAKDARLREAMHALQGFMRKHVGQWTYGGGYWPDYAPWMYPTPVSDGKHVWVKSGFDAAACFDMVGKEIWKVALGGAGGPRALGRHPRSIDTPGRKRTPQAAAGATSRTAPSPGSTWDPER